MANSSRVLVVGARRGSLGAAVADHLQAAGVAHYRAGVSSEPVHLDVCDVRRCEEVIRDLDPTHIVCTVGINDGAPFYGAGWETLARDHLDINFIGPMNLLASFEEWLGDLPGAFVGISSNSAHIARSNSSAYCASKAALSMGLRCAARDLTRAGKPLRVWGYEPGALVATPMTKSVARFLPRGVPMSRMLTNPAGMDTGALGRIVARDLLENADLLHGTMVRLDNGDS